MQIIPPHPHHIKPFLLLSTGILPVLLCSFNGSVQKNERSWDRTWSTSGLSALLTTLPRSLHLCTAAHTKQKNQNLPPRFQPLSSILGYQSKLSCAVASHCHESWIFYWIKTLTLGGKLQRRSWMPTACHLPWTQNPQLWETERPFPNSGGRNLEGISSVQELKKQDTCHNVPHFMS